ncbi:MAG: hypothetical protein LH614_00305 [Pyrinomonadaceae bacterium]|nr:hypothetical protein [Pyrinomonadaceae bacterium]
MEIENTENPSSEETKTGEATANCQNELSEPRWSVVSFEKCAAGNLTYAQAERKLAELAAEKVSGLCIITDEAASRIKS